MNIADIQIRDPFVLLEGDTYYMYGTTDKNAWNGRAEGFDAYLSTDLNTWSGPHRVFSPSGNFWADQNFWAPEVYKYKDRFVMLASFKSDSRKRASVILSSDDPIGSFVPVSNEPITPQNWECLDATLYVDRFQNPWIVFCREWIEVTDGQMWANQMNQDLTRPVGDPVYLFKASDAKWTSGFEAAKGDKSAFVTDGPFIYYSQNSALIMLWSSHSSTGYAIGQAVSYNGIQGPWIHRELPIFDKDGGHGMLFHKKNGELTLAIHRPNDTPNERAAFFAVEEIKDEIRLKDDMISMTFSISEAS